ncbi:endonuclease/exonuclease/phosphatase family protein [Tundrisphaera sp. TA3]|uniref:endonuclease/exonuclease/phosphatase family protein n=1 Tax=Tundrisphaera sp. TA3 TaxID=3435775 RepID=UPI003EBD288D
MGNGWILAAIFLYAAPPSDAARTVRFATFNASLNRDHPGDLARDLATPGDVQAGHVAEIIQRIRPDVLLINEFDHDPDGRSAMLFQDNYLSKGRNGAEPISYPYRFTAGVNTGVASGVDLDGDGVAEARVGSRGYGNDALGFGLFPGQYGMVIYSKYPIDAASAVQFREVLWKDMPGALLPTKADGSPWYSAEALARLRLSSKSHWDVPIRIGARTVHVLASHPTPPSFDGPEDRNGRRNHDEIRLWADFISGGEKARYLGPAAAKPPESFVIMGDLNADPTDGGSVPGAIGQLLDHPRVHSAFVPTSPGGAEAARLQGGVNAAQRGDPAQDTADFDDRSVGNLRADYVLPSADLRPVGGGIFWPVAADPLARLVQMTPAVASSDHRLVYLDLAIEGVEPK